jgi:hypothetical protein
MEEIELSDTVIKKLEQDEEDGSQTQPGGSDEGDSQTQPDDTANNKPGVDTGDHNQIGMYVMLMAVCAAGLVIMLVMKKKA